MAITPLMGDHFGEQNPAYGLLQHHSDPSNKMNELDAANSEKLTQEDAVIIIGAGHFGSRAAELLIHGTRRVLVVEPDSNRLEKMARLPVLCVQNDGIEFLVDKAHQLDRKNWVVPAIPLHLAFEWLKRSLNKSATVKKVTVPEHVSHLLPHTCPGSEGSLLVSYADFVCPEDCPEPDLCTVTGEERVPLYDVLSRVEATGFKVHVIRSHQLAPGLGGYRVGELRSLLRRIVASDDRKWLLGTSCRCHGILTGFEIEGPSQRGSLPTITA